MKVNSFTSSYREIANWNGKWTAIGLYLTSWIRVLSVLLELAHWRLFHPLGLLTWFLFKTLWDFLEFWIAKGSCRNFVLILTFSFYEYFTEVLCTAFYKNLIKYFECVIVKLLLRDTIEKQEVMELYWVSLDVNCAYIVD